MTLMFSLIPTDCVQYILNYRHVQNIFDNEIKVREWFGKKDGRVLMLNPNVCFMNISARCLFMTKYVSGVGCYWCDDVNWNPSSSTLNAFRALQLQPSHQSLNVITFEGRFSRCRYSLRFTSLLSVFSERPDLAQSVHLLDLLIDEQQEEVIEQLCRLFPHLTQIRLCMKQRDMNNILELGDAFVNHSFLKRIKIQFVTPNSLREILRNNHVSEIDLSYGTLSEYDIAEIARSSSLKSLIMNSVVLPEGALQTILENNASLKVLEIDCNRSVGSMKPLLCRYFARNSALETLSILNICNPKATLSGIDGHALSNNRTLKTLEITWCPNIEQQFFKQLSSCQLRKLNLSYSHILPEHCSDLAAVLMNNPNFSCVALRKIQMTQEFAQNLRLLLTQVDRLDLREASVEGQPTETVNTFMTSLTMKYHDEKILYSQASR